MSELRQRIESVARKAGLLTSRSEMLRRDRKAMAERIAELEGENAAQRRKIEELTMELDYLRLASTIRPDAKARRELRDFLAKIVHDIDLCIADLSDCNER